MRTGTNVPRVKSELVKFGVIEIVLVVDVWGGVVTGGGTFGGHNFLFWVRWDSSYG